FARPRGSAPPYMWRERGAPRLMARGSGAALAPPRGIGRFVDSHAVQEPLVEPWPDPPHREQLLPGAEPAGARPPLEDPSCEHRADARQALELAARRRVEVDRRVGGSRGGRGARGTIRGRRERHGGARSVETPHRAGWRMPAPEVVYGPDQEQENDQREAATLRRSENQ